MLWVKKNEWECLTFNFDHVFVNIGFYIEWSGLLQSLNHHPHNNECSEVLIQ